MLYSTSQPSRCSTRIEQRWASVSKSKIWTNPLILPALLCGAAAGNRSHRYIGKVCCLLLVRADYINPRPRAWPRGHWALLKLLRNMNRCNKKSQFRIFYLIVRHFWGQCIQIQTNTYMCPAAVNVTAAVAFKFSSSSIFKKKSQVLRVSSAFSSFAIFKLACFAIFCNSGLISQSLAEEARGSHALCDSKPVSSGI